MNKITQNSPIGFFDSGVGGLSVMRKTMDLMPFENYIYYGDSKNAPYGIKTPTEVKELTFNAVDFLLAKGAKAIVIACNTATSAAIEPLRDYYTDIPIIGIEPALKPAVKVNNTGDVIIMATPMTLSEKKFSRLMNKYGEYKNIVPLPCAGLVEFIEQGILEGKELRTFLTKKLESPMQSNIGTIVLGCTHYPFVKNEIQNIVGNNVVILDGSNGTAKEVQRRLKEKKMLKCDNLKGTIEIYTSDKNEKMIDLCNKLIQIET